MTDPKSSPPSDVDLSGVEEDLEELAPLGENKTDNEITAPERPLSQAALDIQAAALQRDEEEQPKDKNKKDKKNKEKKVAHQETGRDGVENLAKIARFRWLALLTLSLVSVAVWAIEAFWAERPYHWPALELLILTLLLTLVTAKFLRLPTRSGLAAWCWSGTFLISAIYGPPETFFGYLPAALVWSGLLTLIMLWMGVAIWRKLGRYKVIDLLLSLFLIFGALSPVLALMDNIMAGEALNLKFTMLSSSPRFITDYLPWFLWPMSQTLFLLLPVCALFSLGDQFRAFRRRGARHGGNFFLALAFIGLLPYGFLSFDQAVSHLPDLTAMIRDICPEMAAQSKLEAKPASPAPLVVETPLVNEIPVMVVEPAPLPDLPAIPPADPIVPAESTETQPVTPEIEPETQATIVITHPSANYPTAEERLVVTEQKLEQALQRIEELESLLKCLARPIPASPAPAVLPQPETF